MSQTELTGYCLFCANADKNNANVLYHDTEYGFSVTDDNRLFERLVLEINQAGLSWSTILNKKDNFFRAYDEFSIQKVASYVDADRERLLADAGIIRNRLKINAAIYNAQQILMIQEEYGSFLAWLNHFHPLTKDEWVRIFKKRFKFVGGEIVNEFLMSLGYLKGAHVEACPIYTKIVKQQPKWLEK